VDKDPGILAPEAVLLNAYPILPFPLIHVKKFTLFLYLFLLRLNGTEDSISA
jgi:hypothetical protein